MRLLRLAPLALVLLAATASAPAALAQDPPGLGFSYRPTETGLLVQVLADDGPAGPAGLLVGDLVTTVAGKTMAGGTPDATNQWLGIVGGGGIPVILDVQRADTKIQIAITPAPYSRERLAEKMDAPRPSFPLPSLSDLQGIMDDVFFQMDLQNFDAAMNQPPVHRRASREGDDLVIASSTCTVRIPITTATTALPFETTPTYLHVIAENIRIKCSGDPYTNPRVTFDFETEAMRDRAVETARAVIKKWPEAAEPAPPAPPSGDCLSGDCQNGQGVKVYASGARWEGGFVNGAIHGTGTFTLADGTTYTGETRDGKLHGQGTYAWADGEVYTGAWVDGLRTGYGTVTYSGGDTYAGNWREGNRHGLGTYTWTDTGLTFTGQWADDARSEGRETYSDGKVYEGVYADDKRHGQGTMTYASGNTYIGGWVAGQRVGQGTYTWADGRVYTGTWANDGRHEYGVMTWPSGQRHEGLYKADKRSGQGTMTYSDGRVFTGTFDEGRAVEGILLLPGESTPRPVRNEDGAFIFLD